MKTQDKVIWGVIAGCALTALLLMVWFRRSAQMFYLPSGSMEPTIPKNGQVIALNHAYDNAPPQRGDIVILKLTPAQLVPTGDIHSQSLFIKRVVGVPGERVEMKRGVLWVNGQAQKEPFTQWTNPEDTPPGVKPQKLSYSMKLWHGRIYSRDYDDQTPSFWTRSLVTAPDAEQDAISQAPGEPLPRDQYLVLGDHRSNSNDSHIFGPVGRSQIHGKVAWRLSPDFQAF